MNANSNANVLIAFSATDFDGTVSKLRPVTLITGLDAGKHFIVPPAFFNDNFLVTYGLGELVIEKAQLKLEAVANPAPFVYGTPFANLPVGVKVSGVWYKNDKPNDVLEKISTKLLDKITLAPVTGKLNAGDYVVKPEIILKGIFNGITNFESNYEVDPALVVNSELTVTKAPLIVTANSNSKEYGSVDPVTPYTALITGFVAGEDLASSGVGGSPAFTTNTTFNSPVSGNPYFITPAMGTLVSTNYLFNSFVDGSLTITAKPISIIADPQTKVYGNVIDPELTYKLAAGNTLVGSDAFTGTLTRAIGEDVGAYIISQGDLSLGDNYALTFEGNNLNITKKQIAIIADPQTKVYGVATDPPLTYKLATGNILVGTDVFTGSLTRAIGENVGNYAIGQGNLVLSNNYTLLFTGNNLTITKADLTVKPDDKTKVYGDNNPVFTFGYTGFVNGDGASAVQTAPTATTTSVVSSNVGTYPITPSGGLSANYNLLYSNGTLTITKAGTLIVKADDKYIYSGNPQPTYTSTYTGFKNNDQTSITSGPNYNLDRIWDGTLGNFKITPSNLVFSKSQNYSSVTYQTGTLYVSPAKGYQTITISPICIVDRGSVGADGFRYVARFTYNSNNWPTYIYIPLGTDNMLVSDGGNAAFTGQPPVIFKPGSNSIEIPFNGQKLTWTIKSTQSNGTKVTKTGFATSSTTRCAGGGSVAYGGMQLDELSALTDGTIGK